MPLPTVPSPSSLAGHRTAGASSLKRGAISLRLSERKILLFLGDVIAVGVALLIVLALRLNLPFGWQTVAAHPAWFALLIGLWSVSAPLLDAYDLRRASRVGSGVGMGAAVALLVALIYLAIPYYTPYLPASRLTALLFLFLVVGLVSAGRAAYAILLAQPTFRPRVLVVGAGWAGRTLVEAVRAHAPAEYDLVGFIDDDPAKQADTIEGFGVLGKSQQLAQVVQEYGVSEVVVAITRSELMDGRLVQALMDCHEQGIQVTMMAPLYERLTGRVPVEHVGPNLQVILPVDRDPNRFYLLVKRGMDVAIGLLGMAALALLFPFIALALRLESPSPLFYRQVRVGRGGRPFELIKFRTMVPDAEAAGPQWTQEDDRRITRVGRVLRRLHLDELPQAISLLRGEMSFIGPRPERPEFVATLEKQIPFYRARHALRPGVTGWAQVNYGYGSSTEDALVKLQYDLYYNKHCSPYLDLVILVRTLSLILTLRGR